MSQSNDTSVKVAVRIRPLNSDEIAEDMFHCITTVPGENQINAGGDTFFTFDNVFGVETSQGALYEECVMDLVNAAFEGFNATILAYGQTGSGKTYTMGSSTDIVTSESIGIIPRVIHTLFETIEQKESEDINCSYKIYVQFLEIYGEDIKDLLDHTRTAKVTIRETVNGDVFVSGAREEAVNSVAQMMRTLEEGSKHRTTGSTRMNQSSSRSHAIFTVILEQTIRRGALPESATDEEKEQLARLSSNDLAQSQPQVEVRRSNFHFVDLAGSERAKRTGAAGQQMKEGIDINKGLLALGNVISALGDEQKRGKVHVPYRDSKLTRMLQDSLGGNSKTLFICCVSPASINYHESLTALRYANRARNIKNKPVVNRDPTLQMIDDLKGLIQVLSTELLSARRSGHRPLTDSIISDEQLLNLTQSSFSNVPDISNSAASAASAGVNKSSVSRTASIKPESTATNNGSNNSNALSTATLKVEIGSLKSKLADSDLEIKRLTDQLKFTKMQVSEMSERVLLIEAERDFYQMKWGSVCPEELMRLKGLDSITGDELPNPISLKGDEAMDAILGYKRQIDSLQKEISELRQLKRTTGQDLNSVDAFNVDEVNMENELSSSVARVIAQTQEYLKQETMRLRGTEEGPILYGDSALADDFDDGDCHEPVNLNSESAETLADAEEKAFQLRQSKLVAEVHDLGESIQLKEQLIQQLQRSQHQYSMMKAFYEQKLQALEEEMSAKQLERDALLAELLDVSTQAEVAAVKKSREGKLREELKKKEEELKALKKRQDDLNHLSQVQSRYLRQVSKLESDIEAMKRQRIELTKAIQNDKKRHMMVLSDKTKEIEKLKRELLRTAGEVKKLARDKEKAEDRAREAIREGSMLRRRANEMLKFVGVDSGSASAGARVATKKPSFPKLIGNAGTASSTQSAANKYLSEELMKTKKWLEKSVTDLNAREKASDTLRKHCEQQVTLMSQRSSFESQIQALAAKGRDPGSANAISDLEEQIDSINDELKLRSVKIREVQKTLSDLDERLGDDKIIEILKRTAASTLPASHDLIKLLFDMLVSARRIASNREESLENAEKRDIAQRKEIEDLYSRISAAERSHDLDLTRALNEYEEKLQGLFSHSAVGQVLLAESSSVSSQFSPPPTSSPVKERKLERTATTSSLLSSKSPMAGDDGRSSIGSVDSYKMLLAVSTDQCHNLRSSLAKEEQKVRDQATRLSELEGSRQQLQQMIDERDVTISFLEGERQLFRDMAEELKAALVGMGGTAGASVAKQVREKALERGNSLRVPGQFRPPVFIDEHEGSDEDDTESVMLEFNNLADEISRTGSISLAADLRNSNAMPSESKGVVYDRLTNPSNFTGSMKKVFEQDLASKRQKVQKIKKMENEKIGKKEKSAETAKRPEMNIDIPASESIENGPNSSTNRTSIDETEGGSDTGSNVFARLAKNYTGIHKYLHSQEGNSQSVTGSGSLNSTASSSELRGQFDVSQTGQPDLSLMETSVLGLEDDHFTTTERTASRSRGNTNASVADRLHSSTTQSVRLKQQQQQFFQSSPLPPPPKNSAKLSDPTPPRQAQNQPHSFSAKSAGPDVVVASLADQRSNSNGSAGDRNSRPNALSIPSSVEMDGSSPSQRSSPRRGAQISPTHSP